MRVRDLAELLDGTALKWLRLRSFTSYKDFVQAILADFQSFYLNESRVEVIEKRLQFSNEKIVNSVTYMRNEFLTLPVLPSESEQLKIIERNLLPRFITALALHKFQSIVELKIAAQRIEHSLIKEQNRSNSNFRYQSSSQNWQQCQHFTPTSQP